jgi:hypothetical protein
MLGTVLDTDFVFLKNSNQAGWEVDESPKERKRNEKLQ